MREVEFIMMLEHTWLSRVIQNLNFYWLLNVSVYESINGFIFSLSSIHSQSIQIIVEFFINVCLQVINEKSLLPYNAWGKIMSLKTSIHWPWIKTTPLQEISLCFLHIYTFDF